MISYSKEGGRMAKIVIFSVLPPILIFLFSSIGYVFRNSAKILHKEPLNRSDEMVFGHYWIVFSLMNLVFLSRLCDEQKWQIPYITTPYVNLFFLISALVLLIFWLCAIFYLKVLATEGRRQRRRHVINLLGAISIFALCWALTGV